MKRFLFNWKELKSSFWFLPSLIILVSIGAAIGLIYIDNIFDFKSTGVIQYIFIGSADSARSVLSTISSAMIGVAGTVFSITLVALTLASNQFGPRLLRNFMTERINQIVLGSYISTYVYSLIVLNSITDTDQIEFVPIISVFVAILAAVANIILLIVFIHNTAVSIQADNIISEVSKSLSKSISILFPKEMGEEHYGNELPDVASLKKKFSYRQPITSPKSGYLQDIDVDVIFDTAKEKDLLIILHNRPGDYLIEEVEIGEFYSNETHKKEETQKLQDAFIIGKVRTPQKDAEYFIHQMVEIAARALSPGINDPYTAITCIDNLSSTLCHLTKVKFPSKYRYDEEVNLRVVTDTLTFEGMLNAAFNQIRQFAEGSPSVLIRLMEALITINKFAKKNEHKDAIQQHTEMVLRLAKKSFDEKRDLNDMENRSKLIVRNEA